MFLLFSGLQMEKTDIPSNPEKAASPGKGPDTLRIQFCFIVAYMYFKKQENFY